MPSGRRLRLHLAMFFEQGDLQPAFCRGGELGGDAARSTSFCAGLVEYRLRLLRGMALACEVMYVAATGHVRGMSSCRVRRGRR